MKLSFPYGFPLATAFVVSSCGQAAAQSVPLPAVSKTLSVKGQFTPLVIDEVAGVSLKDGQLLVRGAFASVTVTLPPFIDSTKVVRHWALITEAALDGKKLLTFTHDETLDDFTLEVPPTEAEIRYGVFEGRDGDEVMVLAWGKDAACYWGYVRIARPPAGSTPSVPRGR